MTTTDIAVRQQATAIPAKIQYARALADSGLLPAAYRKNPANVLWAAEYGDMLGLTTMAAITGVHVIDGKPTASAGLISALVRRAGHKLRIRGNNKSATCVIVRCDDPAHPFEVTWTLKKNSDDNPSAEDAKLLSKSVWVQYPAAMLKARAITQCARDACEEALFGLHYTAEEMGADVDYDGTVLGDDTDVDTDPDPDFPDEPVNGNGSWYRTGLKRADGPFKSDAEAIAVWKEAGERQLNGEITPKQRDEIQNTVNKRIGERRLDAAARILKPLADDDPWRAKILEELDGNDLYGARTALEDIRQQVGAGTMADELAELLGRAVIARFPKAALSNGEAALWARLTRSSARSAPSSSSSPSWPSSATPGGASTTGSATGVPGAGTSRPTTGSQQTPQPPSPASTTHSTPWDKTDGGYDHPARPH